MALLESQPVSARSLATFFDLLRAVAGPQLLRLKGLIALADDPDRPLVVHGVQHDVHQYRLPAWPSDDRRTRIVAITHGLDEAVVKNLFTAVTGISTRAKAQLLLMVAGLSLLGVAMVVGLVLGLHERAAAQLESTPVLRDSTSSKH